MLVSTILVGEDPHMINQRLDVPIDRPVDGDTVRIIINGKSEGSLSRS